MIDNNTYYQSASYNLKSTTSISNIQILQVAFYLFIWLFGSLCGIIVIYVILINIKFKIIANVYLLNLAIADLIFLQGIPFYITSLINREWVFSLVICKLYFTFTGVNQFTSIFFLTLLAFDRYKLFYFTQFYLMYANLFKFKIFSRVQAEFNRTAQIN